MTRKTTQLPRGKAPCLNRVHRGGKDKGLAYNTQKVLFPDLSKSKGKDKVVPSQEEKVRQLQRALWTCAKGDPERKFPKLFDRMTRKDVLWEAYRRVRANRGAAGVDGQSLAMIERHGADRFLKELRKDLESGRYRPQPVRRTHIPKPDGRQRPLGIPTVRDRVAQMAAKMVLEAVFEADFEACSYGFRPRKSATDALETLRKAAPKGYEWALEIDIEKYFDTIDRGKLMTLVERRITDRRMLKLIRGWLGAGVLVAGEIQASVLGTPQGGVISPLLANIYLHELDQYWKRECAKVGILVRYADDAVVLCTSEAAAREALERVKHVMARLGLKLHPKKTRTVHLRRKGIDFLGCHLRMGASRRYKGRWYLYRWPSRKAMTAVRERIRQLTGTQRTGGWTLEAVIRALNPIIRGWGNYYRTGNATRQFCALDAYIWKRLVLFQNRRRSRNKPTRRREFDYLWYARLHLYRLPGTIRYPGLAHAG
jgi:RNA-directed DNA polymerase